MESTVFDILVYVFDHYMFEELPVSAERADIARDLETAGFGGANVGRALDWLADLADERERPGLDINERAFRLYADQEVGRIDAACRGLLLSLEAPSRLSVGLCMHHGVMPKQSWLQSLGIPDACWPGWTTGACNAGPTPAPSP